MRSRIPSPSLTEAVLFLLGLLLERIEPELRINWGRILCVPRHISACEELVQVQMRAHRAGQSQGGDGGIEVPDQTLRRTPAEIGVDGIKYRSQVLAEDLVGAGQLEACDVQQPHEFRMLRHVLPP
jgi:hypothetical protein